MSLSDVCIRRPVFSIVISLLLVAAGAFALFDLPLRKLPQFDQANISITTQLPGASAKQVESQITTILENAVAGLGGIQKLTSTSMVGTSVIQIKFRDNILPEIAAGQVSAKAIATVPLLPKGVQTPAIQLASGNDQPIIYLGLSDSSRDTRELTSIAENRLVPVLKSVPGIASVSVVGARKYAMIVKLDPVRLAAERLTVQDVISALNAHNATVPSGQLEVGHKLTSIVVHTTLHNISDFENVVIVQRDGYAVRVSDVGTLKIGSERKDNAIRIDGASGVALAIVRRPHSNPLDISRIIKERLPALQNSLPDGMSIDVIFDATISIAKGIEEVFETIAISILLVIVTMIAFLGSWRSSAIVIVTIPVSLISTLALLWPLGFSLNTFTLLAVVLAVGLVVDDAIVDVENVERHIGEGRTPVAAAVIGSREVTMAVIATTLTLAAIYVPIGFMSGKVGHLFREFGFTLAVAVMMSGFVSRTLSPMMCSRILSANGDNPLAQRINVRLTALSQWYRRFLEHMLAKPWLIVGCTAVAVIGAATLLTNLPSELAPSEDQGYVMVQLSASPGTTLNDMMDRSLPVEKVLTQVPEQDHTLVLIGQPSTNAGFGILMLKPWEMRTRSAAEIRDALNIRFSQIRGVQAAAFIPPALGGQGGVPVELIVKTGGSYENLHTFMQDLKQRAESNGLITRASVDLSFSAPKIDIQVNRQAAQRVGVEPEIISTTLSSMLSGARAHRFSWDGTLHPVIVRMDRKRADAEQALNQIHLRSSSGQMIPLTTLTTQHHNLGALTLARHDQSRAATLRAIPAPGMTGSEANAKLWQLAQSIIPDELSLEQGGAKQAAVAAQNKVVLVFGAALLIVFLLLAAQFESFRDPFIILGAAPFALIGGLLGLSLFGGSLNAYSAIALLTLFGMITKHGILITEFANQRRDSGMERIPGLLDAAQSRLRPILMTTTAAIMGALPLLFTVGPGAHSHQQIGLVIICGLTMGTLTSLVLVPFAYKLIAPAKRHELVDVRVDATTGWCEQEQTGDVALARRV